MSLSKRLAAALALLPLLLIVSAVLSDDPKPAPGTKTAKTAAGPTVKVEKGPLAVH